MNEILIMHPPGCELLYNVLLVLKTLMVYCLFFQYVDHIKFCSKFRTPCRFHVVGCDMSVSSLTVHIYNICAPSHLFTED